MGACMADLVPLRLQTMQCSAFLAGLMTSKLIRLVMHLEAHAWALRSSPKLPGCSSDHLVRPTHSQASALRVHGKQHACR